MSAQREVLAVFVGGPCDGGVEPLFGTPPELRFSSARIDGEWSSGALRVADVVYRLDGEPGAIATYRLVP